MFADYKLYVVNNYQERKANGTLPPRLMQPTPANLKNECAAVCKERFDKRDEEMLRTFFGQREGASGYLKAIERFETDKFRPLVIFLKNRTANTDNKNIELLAWLLNLKGRPYDLRKNYEITEENEIRSEDDVLEKDAGANVVREPHDEGIMVNLENTRGEKREMRRVYKLRTTFIILMIAAVLISFATVTYLSKQQKCMYWSEDHYEPVSCNQTMGDTLIVALNEEKLNNFKKITNWDSITDRSIGKVWYVKVDGKIEFYTTGGYHPTKLQLRLKPITLYIINKYVTSAVN